LELAYKERKQKEKKLLAVASAKVDRSGSLDGVCV
jgi:hypothetical protein